MKIRTARYMVPAVMKAPNTIWPEVVMPVEAWLQVKTGGGARFKVMKTTGKLVQ